MVAAAPIAYSVCSRVKRISTEAISGSIVQLIYISGFAAVLYVVSLDSMRNTITPGSLVSFIAVLSVNLGLINLFPIPVLDGGHILLLGIEAIRRKPLQMRQLEVIQQVGLALVLLLMIIVMRNDLTRLF